VSDAQLLDRMLSSLIDAHTAYSALKRLTNEELLELSSLIEHTLFERQRKELSSENTVVEPFDDCF
jgi:hypothetical protein